MVVSIFFPLSLYNSYIYPIIIHLLKLLEMRTPRTGFLIFGAPHRDNGKENGNSYNGLYRGYIEIHIGFYRGYMRIMEKRMETTTVCGCESQPRPGSQHWMLTTSPSQYW